jgi:hypothetical protein
MGGNSMNYVPAKDYEKYTTNIAEVTKIGKTGKGGRCAKGLTLISTSLLPFLTK